MRNSAEALEHYNELRREAKASNMSVEDLVAWYEAVDQIKQGVAHLKGHYRYNLYVDLMQHAIEGICNDDADEAFDNVVSAITYILGPNLRAHT